MRLVRPKDELAGKLAVAGRVASSKSTIQILSHVLLSAEDGRCELAATDMELSLRVPLAATVEEPGSVVLPRLAGDIVRTMVDGPVTLEHRANEGVVSAHRRRVVASRSTACRPTTSRSCPPDEGTGLVAARRAAGRGDRPRGARRLARRDPAGADRRAGADRARGHHDGGHRLLPPGGAAARRSRRRRPSRARRSCRRGRSARSRGWSGLTKAEAVEVVLTESQALFRIGDVRLTSRHHRRAVPGPPPARARHASSTRWSSTGPSCSGC